MVVTNAQYQEDGSIKATISGKEWHNITQESRFWDDVQEWVADGNTIAPAFTDAELLQREADTIRAVRKPLLEEADHMINKIEDNGQDTAVWMAYRQALRDITMQPGFPDIIDWPIKPR